MCQHDAQMITAAQFEAEIADVIDHVTVTSTGCHSWGSVHYRHAFVGASACMLEVMFEGTADRVATAPRFHARPRTSTPEVLAELGAPFLIEARIYATTDESLLGQCACVQSSFVGPYAATRIGLSAEPVWAITIADSRLDARKLYRLCDRVLNTLLSLGRSLDNLSRVGPLPARMRRSNEAQDDVHRLKAEDVRAMRCDAIRLADASVHYGLDSLSHGWGPNTGKQLNTPDLARLFLNRAPTPVKEFPAARYPTITFAGGNAAVTLVDNALAHEVMHAGDELEYVDDDDDAEVQAESTKLAEIARHSGLNATKAKLQILVAPSSKAASDDHMERAVIQDRGASNGARLFVSGVPLCYIATISHLLYDRMHQCDPLDFYGIPDLLVTAMDADTLDESECLRRERTQATRTICNGIERNLNAIKARLWRPGGHLVSRMVHESGCWAITETRHGSVCAREESDSISNIFEK